MSNWQLLASAHSRAVGEKILALCAQLPEGPGVVIASGGTSGKQRWCLQPRSNLEAAAASCGQWLHSIGLDPEKVVVVNPLPSHHMGGLMPQVRAQLWGVPLLELSPEQLKNPAALADEQRNNPVFKTREALISLVPTQLHRLLEDPDGIRWLKGFALIWVGGAGLGPNLAAAARRQQLPLAPCYGATETAAMVTAQTPSQFLAGSNSCGQPLADVQLRLDPITNGIEIRTPRLSPGWLAGAKVLPFVNKSGWWCSGDAGSYLADGLCLLGRLDGALNSGGSTVFPEQIEAALSETPGLAALLVIGVADLEWGERLVALVRIEAEFDSKQVIGNLCAKAADLAPAERPKNWLICPQLTLNSQGKWERKRWLQWAQQHI